MSRAKKKTKKPLGNRGKAAIVAVGLLVVAAAGYFLLVRPKQAEAKELDAQLASIEQQITSHVAATPQAPPKPVAFPELFRMAKAMPDRADMSGMILELNRVAKDTGIVFESISPGTSTPREGYQVVPITVVFEGNFYSLSDFLYRLRNLVHVRDGELAATGRLFAVESLSFAQSEKKFPLLQASLTVNAFVYGTSAPASTAAPPPAAPTGGETSTTGTGTTTTTAPDPNQPPAPPPTTPPPATAAPPAGGTS